MTLKNLLDFIYINAEKFENENKPTYFNEECCPSLKYFVNCLRTIQDSNLFRNIVHYEIYPFIDYENEHLIFIKINDVNNNPAGFVSFTYIKTTSDIDNREYEVFGIKSLKTEGFVFTEDWGIIEYIIFNSKIAEDILVDNFSDRLCYNEQGNIVWNLKPR